MATNKKIRLSFEGKEYTLEFSKNTVRAMQANGFDISKLDVFPNLVIPDLFAGAFRKNHPFIKNDVLENIYGSIRNKDELIRTLGEMYNEPALGLFEEPEDDTKNVEWTVD
ncbi:MAG: DUF5055 domain-containing protein [Ruminococcus sp.]|nr:DUF5055 domain-containing protein [Ruminococcus sp.]MBR1752924.1 DUF5055 domain-containing protein [Ruminococcus sp.]